MNADDEVMRLAILLGDEKPRTPPMPRFDAGLPLPVGAVPLVSDPLQLAADALQALDELGILDKQIAATKARLLALADAAQRIHDAHDGTSTVCPLAEDLRHAAALL